MEAIDNLLNGDRLCQVTWEVDIQTLGDGEPVCHQLERDDVEKTLEAVDRLWDLNLLGFAIGKLLIVGVADDNWLSGAGNDCENVSIVSGTGCICTYLAGKH